MKKRGRTGMLHRKVRSLRVANTEIRSANHRPAFPLNSVMEVGTQSQ